MSDQSFGRKVSVRIFASIITDGEVNLESDITTNEGPVITYNKGYTEFSSVQPDRTPGFRIRGRCIQVQPVVGFNTNQISFSIFNLGANSRAIIQSKVGTRVEIFAGYGDNPKQIAVGDILWAKTHKEGPDYITEVVAADAHFAFVNGKINESFKGSVSFKTVVDTVMANLAKNQVTRGVIDIPDGGYQSGIVLSGNPIKELTEVCRKMGRSLSVIGGAVNILPIGGDQGNEIIELSEDTGLIGIPEVMPPGPIGTIPPGLPVSPDNDLSFVHLLRGDLVLSQRVRINSKFVNGEYIILRNEFEFDSWSGPFYNKCQCRKPDTNGR